MRMLDCYIECMGSLDVTYPAEWIEQYTVIACCGEDVNLLSHFGGRNYVEHKRLRTGRI